MCAVFEQENVRKKAINMQSICNQYEQENVSKKAVNMQSICNQYEQENVGKEAKDVAEIPVDPDDTAEYGDTAVGGGAASAGAVDVPHQTRQVRPPARGYPVQ